MLPELRVVGVIKDLNHQFEIECRTAFVDKTLNE